MKVSHLLPGHSEEYRSFADEMLCIARHVPGISNHSSAIPPGQSHLSSPHLGEAWTKALSSDWQDGKGNYSCHWCRAPHRKLHHNADPAVSGMLQHWESLPSSRADDLLGDNRCARRNLISSSGTGGYVFFHTLKNRGVPLTELMVSTLVRTKWTQA